MSDDLTARDEALVDAVIDLVWAVTDGGSKLTRAEFFRAVDEGRDLATFHATLAAAGYTIVTTDYQGTRCAHCDALVLKSNWPDCCERGGVVPDAR